MKFFFSLRRLISFGATPFEKKIPKTLILAFKASVELLNGTFFGF
jgi:hypothetical protein